MPSVSAKVHAHANMKETYTTKYNAGFTLIELLVVMMIMASLIFIAASTFQTAQIKSRDGQRKSDLKQISNALEAYYNDYGEYPAADGAYMIVGCGSVASKVACTPGNAFSLTNSGGGTTVYMAQLPRDPKGLSYKYLSDGESYQLFARLENNNDPKVKNPDDDNGDKDNAKDIYGTLVCGTTSGCNYGVSSTNIKLEPVLSTFGADI